MIQLLHTSLSRAWSGTALIGALTVALTCPVASQEASLPPVRQLGARIALTHDTLGSVVAVRQLSDGRVLVNDNSKRRVMLFDGTLAHPIVVADSMSSAKRAYQGAIAGLLGFGGDSSLFVDAVSLALVVIDPSGSVARVLAMPRPEDASSLVSNSFGSNPSFDGRGGLIYHPTGGRLLANGIGGGPSHVLAASVLAASSLPRYALHDSGVVIRADLATHRIDTLGFFGVPFVSGVVSSPNPNGRAISTQTTVTPIQFPDDWAMVSDGSVAIVRNLDYHVDWVTPDGARSSTPRIAHEWRRLSDDEKAGILDSIRRQQDSLMRMQQALYNRTDSVNRAQGRATPPFTLPTLQYPQPADLPDYLPVFALGAVRADADNNIWIRQGVSPPARDGPPPVYDVVNRQGRLVDRVLLPPSLTLVGFGPGVVYLASREGMGTVLLKYRIR